MSYAIDIDHLYRQIAFSHIIYITGVPCDMCAKLIAAAGIAEIVRP